MKCVCHEEFSNLTVFFPHELTSPQDPKKGVSSHLEGPVALGTLEALPGSVVVLEVELQRLGVLVALAAQRALERLDVHVHRHVARQRRLREERLVARRAVQQALSSVQLFKRHKHFNTVRQMQKHFKPLICLSCVLSGPTFFSLEIFSKLFG